MMGASIRRWIESAESEHHEIVQAIVVGIHDDRRGHAPLPDECVVLDREAGLKKLDLDFDDGFGGADCFPMFAWSENWVYFVHEYDGATSLRGIPRNPMPCKPGFGDTEEL